GPLGWRGAFGPLHSDGCCRGLPGWPICPCRRRPEHRRHRSSACGCRQPARSGTDPAGLHRLPGCRPAGSRAVGASAPGQPGRAVGTGECQRQGRQLADAERRFRVMAHQGLTQLLQPLLIAWAQQAEGRTGAALATLQPSIDSQRFRGIFALHGAMIADLGNKPEEAGRLYKISQSELPEPSLRLAQILASWQVRSGQRGSVEHTFAVLQTAAPDISIAMRALAANAATRPVARPADGVAEAYF